MKRHASMNRIFRLVWNQTLGIWVPVAENVKGRGKSISGRKLIAAALALSGGAFLSPFAMAGPVVAAPIVPDGRTQTHLAVNGAVTAITTQTVSGANAFNSFSRFNVGNGQTVNLLLPGGTSNLLNLVRDERSQLNGVMNAYKDGRIGGNVFFLNPHGVVVGAGGVLNVGSLTIATPTIQFMDTLIDSSGVVNGVAVGYVLAGHVPLSDSGLIQVKGRINAASDLNLAAGQVAVDGGAHVIAGAQALVSFADLVNIAGVATASTVEVKNGVVRISASGAVNIAGQVATDGVDGVNAGVIDVHAGSNIDLATGADVSANGQGIASSGGNIKLYAEGDATLDAGARVAANGGVSGDGGFVEFSAKNTVNILGGQLEAGALNGVAGTVLIDPADVLWTGSAQDIFSGGTNYAINATNSIVLDNVYIATRNVAVADQNRANIAGATSIGDSGNITLKAPKIKLTGGTSLLANDGRVGAGANTGIVTLEAADSSVLPTLGWATATAQIDIDTATIKGNKVVISAKSNIDSQFVYSSENPVDSALNVGTATAQQIGGFIASLGGVELVVSDVNAMAYVNINSGANIESATSVTISAENVTKAGMAKKPPSPGAQFNTPLGIGALWVSDKSDAKVTVGSGAKIKSADLSVLAHNNAKLEASIASGENQTENSNFTAIAVAITKADVQATATVNSGADLQISGNLTVAATNVGSYSNEVTSVTGPNGRAAAAIAYADHQSGATASLNANVGDAAQVNVLAIDDVLKDTAVALSKVGGTQATSIIASGQQKIASFKNAESVFWGALGLDKLKPDNKSSPTQQSFRIGGAIAYDTSAHTILAEIGDGAVVHATDSVSVLSRIRAEDMKIAAQSSALSTSASKPAANDTARAAYSVGLAIGNYTHDAVSRIGVDADVTAPKIAVYSDTIIPIRDSLLFGSKAATDKWTRWDGLANIMGAIKSITNIFDVFNGVSSAKSTSDGSDGSINLSGSVSILSYTDNSRAILDKGAHLNISGKQSGPWSTSFEVQPEVKHYDKLTGAILLSTDRAVKEDFNIAAPVSVQAKHDATLLFQAGETLPASSGEKGLGVAFDQVAITSVTEAIVREGAVIKGVDETSAGLLSGSRTWTQGASHAASDVNVSAVSDERIISLAVSGGYGATFGANGTYSQMSLNNATHALVDDEVTVNAKRFNVSATASPVLWSLSGGINMSKNASVGIGIAINDVIGNTRAEIADNDTLSTDGKARTSLVTVAGAKITSSDVNVTAKTGGHIEAIAVTGALANNAPSTRGSAGLVDKIKNKTGYTSLLTKVEGLAGTQKSFAKKISASGTAQQKESEPPSYSFAGAGSGAINVTEMLTTAKIEGVTIDQTSPAAASLIVRAISDSDITAASGAAAITRANDAFASKTIGVAGSVAVNSIGNGTQAWLKDSSVSSTGDVTVQALSGGEQLAVALGMAVDASKGPSVTKSDSFVGSLSLTLAQTDAKGDSKNKTIAKIDHSTITGKIASSDRNIDVTAYNRTFIGTGGGSLTVQAGAAKSGTSVGAAVSWANVRNDVTSGIYNNSNISQVDTVAVHAYNATEIGSGAAMVSLSKAEGANSFAGSMVYNQITNNTTAAIDHSTVTATNLVDVQAKDKGADSALEVLIDPAGDRAHVAKGLDYCGESAGASPSGNCIAAVAGTVQIGAGGNYGISVAYNQIDNNLTAKIKDSVVTVTGISALSDKINVMAESDTSILGVGFGAGVSSGKFSGAGSVSIAGIANKVKAEVGQSAVGGSTTTLTAPSVTISSTDGSDIKTLAGQVNVSFKASSLGAAFAYNEINNETRAIADNANIKASYMAEITANENAKISSLSAAAGLAKGTPTSLSASLNFIDDTTEARLSNSKVEDGIVGGTNIVKVKADDTSTIKSLSGSASIGSSNGVGAAFSLNQIGNTNKALAESSTIDGAHQLEIMAHETAGISALAGAFGAGAAGYSGALTLNNIGQSFVGSSPNETTAELKNSTVLNGVGSFITIQGKDESTINSLAGALSLGESGYGGAIADNNIQSTAKGGVSGSSIADNYSLLVDGNNTSTIKSLSAAGAVGATGNAFAGSASSNRTENKTFGEVVGSDITGPVAGGTSGVKVSATNKSDIAALSGGAAISFSTAAVGIAISVNKINDTTEAHVTGKKSGDSIVRNLYVASASDATIKALSIGAAGAAGNALAGSVAVNMIGSNTNAYIDGGAVVRAENNVGVTAVSDDRITVASGSVGVSFGAAGVGVGFNVNSITSNTKAYIAGSTTRVTGSAKNSADTMDVYTGALTFSVNLADQINITEFGKFDLKGKKATEKMTGVAVNASSSQSIENITATLGAGTTGVGAAASVNVIGGRTEAYVSESKINEINTSAGVGQKVAINASNVAYDNSFIVGVGIGGNAGGIGVDTHIVNRTTSAKSTGGSIESKTTVAVKAQAIQGVSSVAAGAAIGGAAGAGTLSLALFSNTTEAIVDGTHVTASGLDIKANNSNNMYLKAGAVSIGGNAMGGAFAVGSSDSTTTATLKNANGANRVDVTGAVNVEAVNTTEINHIAISGAGAGGNAIAGMASVNLITDTTEATVSTSEIGAAGAPVGSVHVKATHTLGIDSKAAAAAGALGGAGVGAGAGVNIVKANTTATVTGSSIDTSGQAEVAAVSVTHIDSTAITLGVGGTVGIGGAAVVTLVGDDVKGDSSKEVGGTLTKVNEFTSGDKLNDLPATGAGGPEILSAADKTRLNADTSKSTTDVTGAGTYAFRTAAEVNGTNTINAGRLDVSATDKTDTKTLVGGFGFGLGGGAGGGVAVINVKANVAANVSAGTTLKTTGNVNVKASADNDANSAIEVLALAGGGGLVGLGAAVVYADITNHVDANLASGANAGAGTVTVTAEDKTKIKVDAKGAAVGAAAAGVVISDAAKSSVVNASAGGTITAAGASISASNSGSVKALGQAAAGGLLGAGSGALVSATDDARITAQSADNTTFKLSAGALHVTATATPQIEAEADGVAVSGGMSIGASSATARSNATIKATLGAGNTVTAGQLDVHALRAAGTAPSSLAQAFGASGGLLLGANATNALATSGGETSARVGDGSTLTVTGATTVRADSESKQTASGLGFSGGIVAAGADFAEASSDTLTQADLGNDVKVTGNSLEVKASSVDTNYAYAVAGSGGALSAPFSQATTSSISKTYARTGSGNNTAGSERKIAVGTFNLSASHDAIFNSWMSSTNASLLGASGAQAYNFVDATTEAKVGVNGYVEADNIKLQALNTVLKTSASAPKLPGVFDITTLGWNTVTMPEWNVDSNSGGLADVPAAGSATVIATNALVEVGADAHLAQTAAGTYTLDAGNDVTAIDKVKMASGGLVSAASGKSSIAADTNNAKVSVGGGATMNSVGDMAFGARSTAKVETQTSVDVYGLVGVAPEGKSISSFKAVNTVDIGAKAKLESLQNILISAGASSNSLANNIDVSARSDVFNNTVIPANKDPVADATIDTKSQINIASGANLGAVTNVMLAARKGSATASGVGIGKDIYRQTLADLANAFGSLVGADEVSFETRTGNSIKTQAADVALAGEVHVGTHRKQKLMIGMKGDVLSATDGIFIQDTALKAVSADILARIEVLKKLITNYTVASPTADASIAVAGYTAEVKFLERKLEAMRKANIAPVDYQPGFYDTASASPRVMAQQAVTGMTGTSSVYATEKTTLTNTNSGLTANNGTLGSANTTLTNANAGLQTQIAGGGTAAQITSWQNQITANNNTITTNTNTINSNNTTISGNVTIINDKTVLINALTTQINSLNANLAITDTTNANYISDATNGGPSAIFVTVSDAKAQLGNIFVDADTLTGTGVIDAPGDASITITNTGPNFVVVNNLDIPSEAGGKVYFNGIDVKDNTQINGVNGATGGAGFKIWTVADQFDASGKSLTPQIVVESQFDVNSAKDQADAKAAGVMVVAPDIVLQGEINNTRGLVKVVSTTGSIRVSETGHIRADTVEIKASNGDFIQSYSKGFTHVGRAPLEVVAALLKADGSPLPFPTNVDTIVRHNNQVGQGIIANGSVLIAGQYLNINGTVQSGISEWGVSVDANSTAVKIVNGKVSKTYTFAEAKSYYDTLVSPKAEDAFFTVNGATVAGLSATEQGAREPISVSYNAKENRLELSNVQIQGGYIGLAGQIFNTNATGGGQLKVMDGYGRIEVNNQTGLALWVNSMDTGRGVKGEISITNATINSAGVKGIQETVYTLDSVGGNRTGTFFTPDAGLEYSKMVGFDSGKIDYYRFSQKGWFNAIITSTANDLYKINTTTTSNAPIIGDAESLTKNTVIATSQNPYASAVYNTTPGSEGATGTGVQTEKSSSAAAVMGASGIDCNWWTLCAQATHWQEYTIASVDKTTVTDKVKADYPIGIEFIGFDNGKVDISSNGNVVINGSIFNRNGDTNVSSTQSIAQNVGQGGTVPVMGGNNINLTAVTGIGMPAQSLTLNVKAGGKLNATSTTGDVRVTQLVGDLNFGTIGGAGVSVVLEAERNLFAFDAASYIQGNRVELLARNGAIGVLSDTANSPLTVRTAYTTDQTKWSNNGLMATARDNINVKNVADVAGGAQYSGNLLLISAESKTGDVRIETSGGVIDNNPYATVDTRSQKALAALWDSMALQGQKATDKADATVAAYKSGKENNYQRYWQLRHLQADSGTATAGDFEYVVSAAERDGLLASGMKGSEIKAFADTQTVRFQELQKSEEYLALQGEVGGFTTAYDTNFEYVTSADEQAGIRKGSSWTDTQLKLSVGAGLLKNITDTVTTIKEPNAKGKNVTLLAGADIGSFDPSLDINWNELKALAATDLTTLTQLEQDTIQAKLDASKAALAAAERGDATVSGNVISVLQPRPVNVTIGTGALNANAENGFALIGSEQDLRLNTVTATGDIRIKTAGSVLNAASAINTVNVVGGNMILEAGNGAIGSSAVPLRIAPVGGVTARAANGIWIDAMQDFYVDTMYSPENIFLTSVGSIYDFQVNDTARAPANNMLADHITLTALGGSIGTLVNPLDVGVTGQGFVTARASTPGQSIYLNGAASENFSLGALVSGDAISLTSLDDVQLAGGKIEALGAITLTAGTDGSGSVLINEEDSGGVIVHAQSTLDVTAANHIVVAGKVAATGAVTLTSGDNVLFTGGSVNSNKDVNIAAGTDGTGSVSIGAASAGNAIDTRDFLNITAADDINLNGDIRGDLGVTLNAGNNVNMMSGLFSTGGLFNANSKNSIRIGGNIFGGAGVGMNSLNDVVFNGGSVNSNNAVNIAAGTDGTGSIFGSPTPGADIVALGALTMQASDSIGAESTVVAHVSGKASFMSKEINVEVASTPLANPLSLYVSDIGGGPAENVVMDVSSDKSVTFATFTVGSAEITAHTPSLQLPDGMTTNYAAFYMPGYSTRIDTLNRIAHPGYDVNAYTLDGKFSLDALHHSVTVGGYILMNDPTLQVAGLPTEATVDNIERVMHTQHVGNKDEVGGSTGVGTVVSGSDGVNDPAKVDATPLVNVNKEWI